VVDGALVQPGQAEPASLIEAQCIEVVVRRDDPQPRARRCCSDACCLREERATDAAPAIVDVEREDLTLWFIQDIRQDADEPAVVVGDHRRVIERPLDAAQASDAQRVPPREEVLDGRSVARLAAPDAHASSVPALRPPSPEQESKLHGRASVARKRASRPKRISRGGRRGAQTAGRCGYSASPGLPRNPALCATYAVSPRGRLAPASRLRARGEAGGAQPPEHIRRAVQQQAVGLFGAPELVLVEVAEADDVPGESVLDDFAGNERRPALTFGPCALRAGRSAGSSQIEHQQTSPSQRQRASLKNAVQCGVISSCVERVAPALRRLRRTSLSLGSSAPTNDPTANEACGARRLASAIIAGDAARRTDPDARHRPTRSCARHPAGRGLADRGRTGLIDRVAARARCRDAGRACPAPLAPLPRRSSPRSASASYAGAARDGRAGLHDAMPSSRSTAATGRRWTRSTEVIGDQRSCSGGQARQQPLRRPLAPIGIKPGERRVEQQGDAAGSVASISVRRWSIPVLRRAAQRRTRDGASPASRTAARQSAAGRPRSPRLTVSHSPAVADPASTTFSPATAQRAGRRTLPARAADGPARTRSRFVLALPLAPAGWTTCLRPIATPTSDSTTPPPTPHRHGTGFDHGVPRRRSSTRFARGSCPAPRAGGCQYACWSALEEVQ
jgi:hypothetical protein